MATTAPSTPASTTHTQETTEAKAAFTASLTSVGTNLDTDLRQRAQALHDNEGAIKNQEEKLKKTTRDLAKQSKELEKLADMGRKGLNEVGDLQNWAELIERDLLITEETLRLAEEEDERNGRMNRKPESKLRRWF
ncbi:DNA mismatch repair protein PMS2 [Blastomyces silverae]|uniref:Biogenesis of lysosome-related organelles complex 1 subunit 1 n=1 Tax=Blastomyces silverae TaxID=2060906 RepID=A0A0H1BJP8_9EURO|nr:DNA mismatch repair protein PMS2 [Blastomyces silverae]